MWFKNLHLYRGSSPLVRGSEEPGSSRMLKARFIPARAGIGGRAAGLHGLAPVHPRSCGDRPPRILRAVGVGGSSPLVRGSVAMPDTVPVNQRFIPARAGIGPIAILISLPAAVHPRSCGDRPAKYMHGHHYVGSSPLVRGSAKKELTNRIKHRFIPARAGIGTYRSADY